MSINSAVAAAAAAKASKPPAASEIYLPLSPAPTAQIPLIAFAGDVSAFSLKVAEGILGIKMFLISVNGKELVISLAHAPEALGMLRGGHAVPLGALETTREVPIASTEHPLYTPRLPKEEVRALQVAGIETVDACWDGSWYTVLTDRFLAAWDHFETRKAGGPPVVPKMSYHVHGLRLMDHYIEGPTGDGALLECDGPLARMTGISENYVPCTIGGVNMRVHASHIKRVAGLYSRPAADDEKASG
jgi:hypothetical protein